MNTESDDTEIVKQFWAYNLPGVLYVNGGNRDYWTDRLQTIFKHLYKDELAIVRKTLASGFLDVAKMLSLS
jgi:predicted phosphohydrolase